MADIRIGTVTLRRAQGVELLLEHQSMPSMESVERMALALRKERSVSRRVPLLKLAFASSEAGVGRRTLSTICVEMVRTAEARDFGKGQVPELAARTAGCGTQP